MKVLNWLGGMVVVVISSAGCVATQDLLRERDALPNNEYQIAKRMSELASQHCIRITGYQSQSKDEWQKGRKLDSDNWAIRRFYTSNTDWYKATAVTSGMFGNLYYNNKTMQFICGDHTWGKYSNTSSIQFVEYGTHQKKLSGVE